MNLKKLLFVLLAFSPTGSLAQNFNSFSMCVPPSIYAEQIIDKVLNETRKESNLPLIQFCKNIQIPNAFAFSQLDNWGNIRHTIHYNPMFMSQLDISVHNEWAQLSVFAHEVGHLVQAQEIYDQGRFVSPDSLREINHPWGRELFADEHAGFIMAKMGANPDDIIEAQLFMFTLHGTPTHPDTISRLQAINQGYARGGGNESSLPDPRILANNIFEKLSRW